MRIHAGNEAMLRDFPWHHFKRVVDIGGANGSALAAVLKYESRLEGILFEQPQVLCTSSQSL